jgi:methylamine utilization protein MauE
VTEFLASVAAFTSFSLLVWAGVGHALHFADFVLILNEQDVIRSGWRKSAAASIVFVEITIGSVGLVSFNISAGTGILRSWLLVLGGLIFVSYAAYALFLRSFRPGVPCGCSSTRHPADSQVVMRAIVLALGLSFSFMNRDVIANMSMPGRDLAVVLLASLASAIILWNFPAALGQPATKGAPVGRSMSISLGG